MFLGSNQYWAGRVYGFCVFMSGAPEGSTGSGSGLKHPTDGNTALRLIDYWNIASKQLFSPIYKKILLFCIKITHTRRLGESSRFNRFLVLYINFIFCANCDV